jgi:3-vinyl bacteriochlorophyllide hydratase
VSSLIVIDKEYLHKIRRQLKLTFILLKPNLTIVKQQSNPKISAAQNYSADTDHPISLGLYTAEQKARRDSSVWTLIQGVLAPVQFCVFAISLYLVIRFLLTGLGEEAAIWSIVIKTMLLYTIMITGCIWEKVVFDKYLFADAFFWEDVFSMLVLALHTAYLICLFGHYLSGKPLMYLALAAYGAYFINATQFVLKLRAARLQANRLTFISPSIDVAL